VDGVGTGDPLAGIERAGVPERGGTVE
jgi:hypothetical protein